MADVDIYTKKPRAPRIPYTELTQTQIENIKQDKGAFFHTSTTGWTPSVTPYKNGERAIMKRFANSTNMYLIRGKPMSEPYCWIDEQVTRDLPALHNTSRHGSALKWGPEKQGFRTVGHPDGDVSHKFLTIGLYQRHPTNLPGEVVTKFGRPGGGYYSQRFPQSRTWFSSSAPLNQTQILENVRMKTKEEHDAIRAFKQNHLRQRSIQRLWPDYTQYTDSYTLLTKTVPKAITFADKKKRMLAARAEAELDALAEARDKSKAEAKAEHS